MSWYSNKPGFVGNIPSFEVMLSRLLTSDYLEMLILHLAIGVVVLQCIIAQIMLNGFLPTKTLGKELGNVAFGTAVDAMVMMSSAFLM